MRRETINAKSQIVNCMSFTKKLIIIIVIIIFIIIIIINQWFV